MRHPSRWIPLLVTALIARTAAASDSWSTPYPGVRHLYRTTGTPWRIHALVVDLCAAGISLRATASSERKRTVPSFASLVSAEAAINGDFFSYATYGTSGLAMGNGQAWHDTKDGNGEGFIAFGPDRVHIDPPSHVLGTPPPWMHEIIGGKPQIVVDGTPVTNWGTRELCTLRHPRTAAGLSKDRRTLYIAVVDGRSSVSVGMTCGELATLMHGLGAHQALNLDGGGSSTLWLRGKGVLNSPSDGAPRVVGNHLAIQASGAGTPGACDPSPDEVELAADAIGASRSTDIDGDGKADVCARSGSDLRCHLSTGSGVGAAIIGPKLSDTDGWTAPDHYATIRFGDINGDGKADLCARSTTGVQCWLSTGSGFGAAFQGPVLADGGGWNQRSRYATLQLADFNGDGKADLCVRSGTDFRCYPSTGSGFGAAVIGPKLDDASGWGEVHRYGTIRMGDVNGDGKADLCARAASGMLCWLSDGTGFATQVKGPAWTDAAGWTEVSTWSTIRLVDVNGDGKADLCARTTTDFRCHLSKGSSFEAARIGPALSDASGWWRYSYYSTIRIADIDGDGDRDLCARGASKVSCWPWTGNGFGAAISGPAWSDAAGWGDPSHFRTIRLADVNGDGKADLCGRGASGVECWISTGSGFTPKIDGPAWSDVSGWSGVDHYGALRIAGVACVPQPEICDGKDNDCDGKVDEDAGCTAPDAGPDDQLDGGVPDAGRLDDASEGDGGWSWNDQPTVGTGCGCRLDTRRAPWSAVAPVLLVLALAIGRRRRPARTTRGSAEPNAPSTARATCRILDP
jgi:hypothetical protein